MALCQKSNVFLLPSGHQGQMNMAGAPPLSSVCKIHQFLTDKRPTVSQTVRQMTQPVCYFFFFILSYTCISQNPTIAKHAVCWLMFWFSPMTCSHSVTYVFMNYSNNKKIKKLSVYIILFFRRTDLSHELPTGSTWRNKAIFKVTAQKTVKEYYSTLLTYTSVYTSM